VSLVASTGLSRGRSQRSLLVSVGTTFCTDSSNLCFEQTTITLGLRFYVCLVHPLALLDHEHLTPYKWLKDDYTHHLSTCIATLVTWCDLSLNQWNTRIRDNFIYSVYCVAAAA
jgi:hypothetical protein